MNSVNTALPSLSSYGRRALTLCWVLGFAACSGAPVEPPPGVTDPIDDTWDEEGVDDTNGATLNPVLPGRAPRRLTVDQLRHVVPQIAGGQTWHQDLPYLGTKFLIPMFDFMGPTLGEADYLTSDVTFADPIPSFMKYVDEMAAQVCSNAVLTPESYDSIVRYPNDVDQNLRYLRLKFHGIYIPEGSTEGIEAARTLYDTLYARYFDHENAAYHAVPWLGVCTALMTDPEFYVY